MPRRREWVIGDQVVNLADVRRWMQSVGFRCPRRLWWQYIRQWDVPRKIAMCKASGTLEHVIAQEAARNGVLVRQARTPSVLTRLRREWPAAANDSAAEAVGHGEPEVSLDDHQPSIGAAREP